MQPTVSVSSKVIRFLSGLILDPEGCHYRRLRNILWLYVYLLLVCSPRTGKLRTSFEVMGRDMGLKPETIASWLGHLRKMGYVGVKKDGAYRLIGISGWREQSAEDTHRRMDDAEPGPKKIASALGSYIATILKDEENIDFYQNLALEYPRDVIRRALADVEKVPDSRIKRSKGALFTYLVRKYGKAEGKGKTPRS